MPGHVPSSTAYSFAGKADPLQLRGRRCIHTMPSSRPDAETLFSYTFGRWLSNEEAERRGRYVSFDPDGLERIACKSVGAQKCLSWQKIGEGSFNRVFLLQFDNGTEAAVRIPFPIAGNVGRSVASEVATMCYVRERWRDIDYSSFPFPPKVFAWDSSHDNPARTPYIILEYAPGVRLGERWLYIRGAEVKPAIDDVQQLELALLSDQLSQNGSLYFADGVSEELRNRPLYPEGDDDLGELARQLDSKYKIGPTANREWWRGPYGGIHANRGPWPDMQTMIRSAAEFQLRAIDTGAVDIASPGNRSTPSDIPLLRRLLHMCIRAAPLVVPTDPELTAPVLNHPDLALTNLIVPPDGPARILHSIDWQGATVSPFCMQAALPSAMVYRDGVVELSGLGALWPEDFDSKTEEEKEFIRLHHRLATRHCVYELQAEPRRPRTKAMLLPHFASLVNLVTFITRCIADGPADLLEALVGFQQQWPEITSDGSVPCPIDFTPEEAATYAQEVERQKEYGGNVARLYDALGCLNDGSVVPELYEEAKARMERLREEWDETAMKGPFPFAEGITSPYLS
ncbi:hypothetical protein FKP32DRAFT_1593922 [Trametes sanguinea]|nr:hypothetical protein FKP32DRAFT_1593922 [Trametes sanguinea]